jgi:hypothetical protein
MSAKKMMKNERDESPHRSEKKNKDKTFCMKEIPF